MPSIPPLYVRHPSRPMVQHPGLSVQHPGCLGCPKQFMQGGMAKNDLSAHLYLTRAEAAGILRISTRRLDELATAGEIMRTKLGPKRTGFTRDTLQSYIARMNGSPAPDQSSGVIDAHLASDGYGSPVYVLKVGVPDFSAEVAEGLDGLLAEQGVRGCLVISGAGHVAVLWARNLNLEPATVRKALDTIRARATLAA